ncbi:uncharacterized protein [Diadema setosum]|uniref:uncharacterized protein n=1 Tax=Diadema setosum TaxID=31175 RepID=UPI003B3BDB34
MMDCFRGQPQVVLRPGSIQAQGFQSLGEQEARPVRIKQSRPLPPWLWYIIAKSLGIKTHPKDRPIFALFLYLLTLLSTVGYVIASTWYTVSDIVSQNTTFDSLNGTVNILMALMFCSVTVYANNLAFRLFTNRLFVQSVRLHTKTFLKMNSAVVIGFLGLTFIGLYNYDNRHLFHDDTCNSVAISPWICFIQYPCLVGLTAFSFLWNMLVAVACLSVCRTHTISVRHFLLELDEDAMICHISNYHRRCARRHPTISIAEDQVDGTATAILNDSLGAARHQQIPPSPTSEEVMQSLEDEWDMNEHERRRISVSRLHRTSVGFDSVDADHSNHDVWAHLLASGYDGGRQGNSTNARSEFQSRIANADGVKILENKDILEKYWRLQCRLRTTSHCIQRWLLSWIVLLIFWSVVYLLYWISHEASIIDMFLFLLPLAILPLLCAGPTEVNGEGHKVPKSICPTEERLKVISFIKQSPLSLTLFGFELNYSSVFTTIVAIALAFATKIILQDVSDTSSPSVHPSLTTPASNITVEL